MKYEGLVEYAKEHTMYNRLKVLNWSVERALTTSKTKKTKKFRLSLDRLLEK